MSAEYVENFSIDTKKSIDDNTIQCNPLQCNDEDEEILISVNTNKPIVKETDSNVYRFHCIVCNAICYNVKVALQHLQSDGHLSKRERWKVVQCVYPDSSGERELIKQVSGDGFLCLVCVEYVKSIRCAVEHLQSKKHSQQLEKVFKWKHLQCSCCNLDFVHNSGVIPHFQGPSHAGNMEKKFWASCRPAEVKCSTCVKCKMYTHCQAFDHFCSKKHAKNLLTIKEKRHLKKKGCRKREQCEGIPHLSDEIESVSQQSPGGTTQSGPQYEYYDSAQNKFLKLSTTDNE